MCHLAKENNTGKGIYFSRHVTMQNEEWHDLYICFGCEIWIVIWYTWNYIHHSQIVSVQG